MLKSNSMQEDLQIISQPNILIQSSLLKKIRGRNFTNGEVRLYCDSKNKLWLWKSLQINALIHEYIVAFLAKKLEIKVPQSIIAYRYNKTGLLQEFITNGIELNNFQVISESMINKTEILNLLVFEAWIGAFDRHGANYITSNNSIWAVDFEESFYPTTDSSEINLYLPWIQKFPREIKMAIDNVKAKIKEENLLSIEIFFYILEQLESVISDNRGISALQLKVHNIFNFLKDNFENLEIKTELYLSTKLANIKI